MSPLLIYISIAQSIANALLEHKADPGKISEFTGYLNLASALAARALSTDPELEELDEQIKAAVAAGRGLTPSQRAQWRSRDDVSTQIAVNWLAEHPKP